jgi:hypothetical protein
MRNKKIFFPAIIIKYWNVSCCKKNILNWDGGKIISLKSANLKLNFHIMSLLFVSLIDRMEMKLQQLN